MTYKISRVAMERGCNRVLAAFENIKPAVWLNHQGISKIAGELAPHRRRAYKTGWSYPYVQLLVAGGRLQRAVGSHPSKFRLAPEQAKTEPERETIRVKLAAGDNDTVFMLSALLHLDPPVVMHNALEAYKEQIRKG